MTNIPEKVPSYNLAIRPYGLEVFTDFERGKSFPVLFYRHAGTGRAFVLTWIGDVLDDLAGAGLHVADSVKIQITADQARAEPVTARTKYRCHLEVPVTPAGEGDAERWAFIEELGARYGK